MLENSLNTNWQPVVLEVSMYESIALLLKALENPLSSPVAWFGVLIALIRVVALVLKSVDDYKIRKMKKTLMEEEIDFLKSVRSGKKVEELTDEEILEAKNKLINEIKQKKP